VRKSLLEWLQDYAIHTGLVGLVEGMLAVVVFAGALSALLGTMAIKAGALVAVVFAVAGLIALLSFNRTELKNKVDLHRNLLSRYCSIIYDRFDHSYRTTYWKDVVVVSPDGDAHETITVRAVVECDALEFYKIYTGSGWCQPQRHRDGVRTKVRSLRVAGEGGTRRDITTTWSGVGNLEIIVHFGEPMLRDSEISFQVELDWPGKCVPLMRKRTPDEFVLTFSRPNEYLEYVIVLPSGCEVYHDVVGLVRGQDTFQLSCGPDGEGGTEVRLMAHGVREGQRVGLRLDRK
jgi:hypothetical protein